MRRKLTAVVLASLFGFALPVATASADPDFGPGNSQKGPKDPGAKCHPPGTTADTPGCK